MTKNPLVTISIPTFNSAAFLDICLSAIEAQTYKHLEINIVDGGSTDDTIAIAKKHAIENIVVCKDALLKAREVGVQLAKGELILLLDSDQVLESTAIERAVQKLNIEHLDMLVLEEDVYRAENWIEKLFQQDRKLIHTVRDFDPQSSVMLPRLYNTNIVKKAFQQIPTDVLNNVGGQDHAIIYYEAWQQSQKIALLKNAVQHIEPRSLKLMVTKFYRWGYTSESAHNPRYAELLSQKQRFRKGMFTRGLVGPSFASILLLLIKGIPFYLGLFVKKVSK